MEGIPVSAAKGWGLEELRAEIEGALARAGTGPLVYGFADGESI